jgi:hypothetical protein
MPAVKKSIATALPANPYNRCAILKTDAIARSEVRLVSPSKIARPAFLAGGASLRGGFPSGLVPDGLPAAIIAT